MISLKKLMKEMPVDTHQTIGDFSKGSSFTNKTDRALITNPTSVKKVIDFFQNTNVNFDFYFVNTKEGRKYTEKGEVKDSFIYDELKIKPDQLKDGRINKDNITVFFTNNKGDERYPLTAWVIAHRVGHVLRRQEAWDQNLAPFIEKQLAGILTAYGITPVPSYSYGYDTDSENRNYEKRRAFRLARRHLSETIGTFKSARDKNLREDFEFHYELFAQYLKTGKVTFNPLPDILLVGHGSFGRERKVRLQDRDEAEYCLENLEDNFEQYAEDVLQSNVGRIFVM